MFLFFWSFLTSHSARKCTKGSFVLAIKRLSFLRTIPGDRFYVQKCKDHFGCNMKTHHASHSSRQRGNCCTVRSTMRIIFFFKSGRLNGGFPGVVERYGIVEKRGWAGEGHNS